MTLTERRAICAYSDALIVLQQRGHHDDVKTLLERWSDVEIYDYGITTYKGVAITMGDNPDESYTNKAISVLTLPFRVVWFVLTLPFRWYRDFQKSKNWGQS